MDGQSIVAGVLLILGAVFLVANASLVFQYLRYVRLRSSAVLTWAGAAPPYYGVGLALGVVLGVLMIVNVLFFRRIGFGVSMMFVYYGYLVPLSRRIGRGFYRSGIWSDSGFIPYNEVGGISWRESEHSVSLVVISRLRKLARRLAVPMEHYSAARRLLRDKIGEHEIHFSGTGLDLGAHDERDEA